MYRLSRRQAFGIWVAVVLASAGSAMVDCFVFAKCTPSLSLSLLSAFLGLLGTVVIATPSLILDFQESERIASARDFREDIRRGYRKVDRGEVLRRGEPEFEAMERYLRMNSDYNRGGSTISKGSKNGAISYFVAVDGNDTVVTHFDIERWKESYGDRITDLRELEDEKQERLFVLLGCGIYGQAIMFQALSTIIPNLNSFTL